MSDEKPKFKPCRRCDYKASTEQVCQLPDVGYFDVGIAETIIKTKPRRPKKISLRRLRALLKKPHYSKRHLRHVDMSKPGIIGRTERHEFLLDGTHRGMNALQARKELICYELTEFETGMCCSLRVPAGTKFAT